MKRHQIIKPEIVTNCFRGIEKFFFSESSDLCSTNAAPTTDNY